MTPTPQTTTTAKIAKAKAAEAAPLDGSWDEWTEPPARPTPTVLDELRCAIDLGTVGRLEIDVEKSYGQMSMFDQVAETGLFAQTGRLPSAIVISVAGTMSDFVVDVASTRIDVDTP